jgi:cell division inhibitor SulA
MVAEPVLPSPNPLAPFVWRYGKGLPAPGRVHGLATGFPELDRALPQHGWFGDGLNELLGNEQGAGEFSLLLPALKQVCAEGKGVLLANPPFLPYAPALAQAGLAFAHLIIVRQADTGDLYWAAEQALRSKACGAVVVWSDESARRLPDLILRRLQVAAHAGSCAGFLFRPRRACEQPSPAPLRIVYAALQGALELTLHKCRGLAGTPRMRVQPWRHAWAARPLPVGVPHPAPDAPHATEHASRSAAPAHPALRWNLPMTGGLATALAAGKFPLEPAPGPMPRGRA